MTRPCTRVTIASFGYVGVTLYSNKDCMSSPPRRTGAVGTGSTTGAGGGVAGGRGGAGGGVAGPTSNPIPMLGSGPLWVPIPIDGTHPKSDAPGAPTSLTILVAVPGGATSARGCGNGADEAG